MSVSSVRSNLHPAGRPARAAVYAIASGKGGVGKTWLAVSLAHALAARQRRVLLFDADLGLANVDIQLGLAPARDLGHVVRGEIALDDAVTAVPDTGFDVIAGKSGSGLLADLPAPRLKALRHDLWALGARYQAILLDLGAGLEQPVRALVPPGATTLIVVTGEPTSMTDAYAFIKVLRRDRPDADIRIVINMAASIEDGRRTYDALATVCRNFLKAAPGLAGVIRCDARVIDAIRRQTPFLARHPGCETAADLAAFAARLDRAP